VGQKPHTLKSTTWTTSLVMRSGPFHFEVMGQTEPSLELAKS